MPTGTRGQWTHSVITHRAAGLVLVAEEAHWADGASARLLDRIAAASEGRPWAVIAVRRR